MDHVIDPSAPKEVAMSSLDWCARSRQVALMRAVLAAHFSNAAISDLERECSQVLRHAVTSGCRETLTSLLRHVDRAFLQQTHDAVLSSDVKDGRRRVDKLLGLAVEHGHREIAEVLLSRGADPNCAYHGKPLLHLALSLRHHDVSMTLLDAGADINMADCKGETAIFAALSCDSEKATEVVERLIRDGADVTHRSLTGRQPVHAAALSASPDALARLLQAGSDVSSRDGVQGDTALHLACSRCRQDAIVTLLQHGARLNGVNGAGHTPLRRLLQHATRAARDYHGRARLAAGRTLARIGFRLDPPRSSSSSSSSLTLARSSSSSSSRESVQYAESGENGGVSLCETPPFLPLSASWTPPRQENVRGSSDGQKNRQASRSCLSGTRKTFSASEFRFSASRDKVAGLARDSRDGSRGLQQAVGRAGGAQQAVAVAVAGGAVAGVGSLQHLCRLQVRLLLPTVRFQEAVGRLDLAPHLQHYVMFRPRLLDHTL